MLTSHRSFTTRIRSCCKVATLVVCGWLAGCQLTPAPRVDSCPLPQQEQVAKILKIVPLGTSRDEVAKTLREEGILGSFNENRTIFYCDLWDRGDNSRWHINVTLLFDADGNLYATQPDAQGSINPSPASRSTSESTAAGSLPAGPRAETAQEAINAFFAE